MKESQEQMIEAWFDGCCEPSNPGGHASYGALVKIDGERRFAIGRYVGFGRAMSNNVAEYSGCIEVLEWIHENAKTGIIKVRGDSKLVIKQLSGSWKVHGGLYVPFYHRAKALLHLVKLAHENNVSLSWIPRRENSECDVLSKSVLKDRGVEFRIQKD